MKCHKCGEKFPANLAVSCSPGGQEAPGIFLVITMALIVAGFALMISGIKYWHFVAFGAAVFVGTQIVVAFFDCRNSSCPKCNAPAKVRPWSF